MLDKQRLEYLQAMGITVYVPRQWLVPADLDGSLQQDIEPQAAAAAALNPCADMDWEELAATVAGCQACELYKTRSQTVFGVGNRQADWLIIGEAPGAEEDRQGEPFVGRAGKLLDEILSALGLTRKHVYIANVLKCRPPNNRDPSSQEVACCEHYLKRQVQLVQPKIILAVGGVAAKNLLKSDKRVGEMRGQQFSYADTGIPLVVTYHPAYLLRSPREKRKVWQDIKYARQVMSDTGTDQS
jgi:DNA polymerase